ncbi:MAG TPA: hypothetical protein VHE61_01485 [Opitutaceae bacterium]|nr:hypothetical protein [Opitutaceae bacterium]
MTEEEIRRILQELDSALEIIRRQRSHEFDHDDAKIQVGIAEIRRELAMYRVLVQAHSQRRKGQRGVT